MASNLTQDDILKLANLAKLRLSKEEILQYQKELSKILDYVAQLDKVDVAGLKPSYQVTGLKNVFREDEVVGNQAKPENLMKLPPKTSDGYIQVGRMI